MEEYEVIEDIGYGRAIINVRGLVPPERGEIIALDGEIVEVTNIYEVPENGAVEIEYEPLEGE